MTFNAEAHHRRSIRLRGYDYSSGGAYFVTICSYARECVFGEVADGEVRLNEAGRTVDEVWRSLESRFPVAVDEYVVMPNHFHGILAITADVGAIHELPCIPDVGAIHELPCIPPNRAIRESPLQERRRMVLPKVVGYLKMNSAKLINLLRRNSGCPVWQRNYYEHIIRNEDDLANIRRYIAENPLKWDQDENHPSML